MSSAGLKEIGLFSGCIAFGAVSLFAQLLVRTSPDQPHQMPGQIPPVIAPPVTTPLPVEPRPVDEMDLNRLVDALVQVESAGNPHCVGNHGERGLMQMKQSTWNAVTERLYGRPVSFQRAFEPGMNRSMGMAYLQELRAFLASYKAGWQADERTLLIACYNCGPTRVMEGGFSFEGLPSLTRDYVTRVLALADER